jgi:hypothetical protein
MTPTKRKRLYIESGKILPGDSLMISGKHALYSRPNSRILSTRSRNRPQQPALVIGLDEHLEWAMIMLSDGGLHWIKLHTDVT